MDDNQITLIQDSFKKVAPISDVAAEIFYTRLFEIAPEVKPFFERRYQRAGQQVDGDPWCGREWFA